MIAKCDNILLLSSIGRRLTTYARRKRVKLEIDIDPVSTI
ncbi:hypothetical protein [Syntrophomonas palmitatica]